QQISRAGAAEVVLGRVQSIGQEDRAVRFQPAQGGRGKSSRADFRREKSALRNEGQRGDYGVIARRPVRNALRGVPWQELDLRGGLKPVGRCLWQRFAPRPIGSRYGG